MAPIPFRPIFSSMARNKAGVFIMACQVALTLAIVANIVFVIGQRVALLMRPSGLDETNIVVVDNHWAGPLTLNDARARTEEDLAAIRALPGVVDAYSDFSYAVAGPWGSIVDVSHNPDQRSPTSIAGRYFADEHALRTLGLRLIKGRNFEFDEVISGSQEADPQINSIIITEDLSRKLFQGGEPIGRNVFINNRRCTVVGVVERLQTAGIGTSEFEYLSVLLPVRLADVGGNPYLIRTQPGAAEQVRKTVTDALYRTSRLRVLDRLNGAQRFATLRSKATTVDRGLVILLSVSAATLLLATAGGIIGMTTFWVEGQRRALGVRRALGATRLDILAHILAENFFIVFLGIVCGSVLALAANIGLMQYLALKSLPPIYITVTSLFVLLLGQCAALQPARRASRVSPGEAMRIIPG